MVVYRVLVDWLLKKLRLVKDVFLLEVLKVIDNGNGRWYFCGRFFGKVNFVLMMWFVWIWNGKIDGVFVLLINSWIYYICECSLVF